MQPAIADGVNAISFCPSATRREVVERTDRIGSDLHMNACAGLRRIVGARERNHDAGLAAQSAIQDDDQPVLHHLRWDPPIEV